MPGSHGWRRAIRVVCVRAKGCVFNSCCRCFTVAVCCLITNRPPYRLFYRWQLARFAAPEATTPPEPGMGWRTECRAFPQHSVFFFSIVSPPATRDDRTKSIQQEKEKKQTNLRHGFVPRARVCVEPWNFTTGTRGTLRNTNRPHTELHSRRWAATFCSPDSTDWRLAGECHAKRQPLRQSSDGEGVRFQ